MRKAFCAVERVSAVAAAEKAPYARVGALFCHAELFHEAVVAEQVCPRVEFLHLRIVISDANNKCKIVPVSREGGSPNAAARPGLCFAGGA